MTGWVVAGVYVAGFLATYPWVYLVFAESDDTVPDGGARAAEARVVISVIAFLCSIIWPVVVVGLLLYRFLTPQTTRERAAELDRREARIAELERDTGDGSGS